MSIHTVAIKIHCHKIKLFFFIFFITYQNIQTRILSTLVQNSKNLISIQFDIVM